MCIGIPGKIVRMSETAGHAWVDVAGIEREVNVQLVADAQTPLIDQWVLVHVGFAMSCIDEEEANTTLALLQEMESYENDVSLLLSGQG